MDIMEVHLKEDRDTDLEVQKCISILDNWGRYWKDLLEKNINDKGQVHALRFKVYIKEKVELIKQEFLVKVSHQKGVKIVWNCTQDNIIREKEENR